MPGPMLRLGEPDAGALRVEVDDEREEYVRAKGAAQGIWCSETARSQLEGVVCEWLGRSVRAEHPTLLSGSESLDELIAKLQEDVVIMHRDPNAPAVAARAAYVNVSFPSGWCPPCTSGRSFVSIHGAVPNVDEFGGPGRKSAAEQLFRQHDSVRFTWSLTPDRTLDRRKCHRKPGTGAPHESAQLSWDGVDRLYLRVERQVISAIDADTACFLIRVYRYDMRDLQSAVRERIRASVATMPAAISAYKGIADARERILALIPRR